MLGTNQDYFRYYRYGDKHLLEFAAGKPFEGVFDTVLGAEVASKLGYKLNEKIVVAHGAASTSFTLHDDKPFHVVGILKLEWENLELPGQGLADIMRKYQLQIDAIPEGDPSEKTVMEKMQAELNAAPVNAALNGKKIKIPGFISPLEVDETKGVVKEFLLVPYFGACIHVPPPPLNQTLFVKPAEGKSIGMDRMYEPVWVSGTIVSEQVHTDLAEAGYQIKDASVTIYEEKENDTQQRQD